VPARPTTKRLDLQGVRALAVGLVVLNHAFDWPAGGFVGVDIFFVISGFLMTSLLYRECERTGTIAFLAFYRRRIRRLVPASATVVVVTIAGAFALFGSGRFLSTVWDGVAALFFVSNWRFAAAQTDYFAQGAQASPLQHYWSLSLEEQYYLVWPIAVLVLGLLVARQQRARATAAVQCLVITAGLFLVSLQLTQSDNGSAYFITPARLWELSVGSTIALCMPLFDRLPARLRPAIMLLALGGMLASSVITPSGAGFPAPWALVAVISTAVFIAFPWQPRRAWLNPLANPVMTHIGDISYSLYLWHFPALILITEAFRGIPGDKSAVPAVVSIAVALGLSELSYRYVEETVRKSRWLEPKKKRRAHAPGFRGRAIGLGSVAAVTGAALVLAFTVQQGAQSPEPTTERTAAPGNLLEKGAERAALDAISAGIKTAMAAKTWPQLSPSMDSVIAGYEHDPATHACAIAKYPGVEACTWGATDAPRSIAIVGDSTSVAYVAMLRAIAEGSGGQLRFTALGMYSCPFVDIPTSSADPGLAAACPERKDLEIANVAALKPELLFVTNAPAPYKNTQTGKEITVSEYQEGVKRLLERVAPDIGKPVFLAAPPTEKDVRECYSPRTSPSECVTTVQEPWKRFGRADAKAAAAFGGVRIDTRPLFCLSDKCPAFADGIPVKFDNTHITDEYGRHIAPAVVALLAENGISLTGGETAEQPPAS